MKNIYLCISLAAFLCGCEETKKLNMAEYGYDKAGTHYIKKIDSISEIYETDETRWEDSWFSNRKFQYTVAYNCLKFTFDGQEKKYCARVFMSTDGSNEGDYDDKKQLNKEGLDNLKRLKSKLHQLANDDSLLDRVMNFFKPKKIEEGKAYNIDNILYKTSSADLTPESKVIIETFADYLKDNPALNVEIQGHTDNLGVAKNNLALSADRAFTVMALLQELGIAKERLSFKGLGDTKPIADNTKEEGRTKNRRTEFLILNK